MISTEGTQKKEVWRVKRIIQICNIPIVWECINSQSRHSHSRRSTSRTQLRVTDRRSIRQSKTLSDSRSPIIGAPQPRIIQSAHRVKQFRSVTRSKSQFTTSVAQPIRFSHVGRSSRMFETTRTGSLIVQHSSLLFTQHEEIGGFAFDQVQFSHLVNCSLISALIVLLKRIPCVHSTVRFTVLTVNLLRVSCSSSVACTCTHHVSRKVHTGSFHTTTSV